MVREHISRARECIGGMRERDQQIKQIAHKQIDDQSLAQDLMELAAVRIINLQLIKLLSASYSFFLLSVSKAK
jgi:hypothetical protein